MNHNSMPIWFSAALALGFAHGMASRTGRRWRVRQVGRLWIAHETDMPVALRKKSTS